MIKTITEKRVFEMTEELLDTISKAKKEGYESIVSDDYDGHVEVRIEWQFHQAESSEDETAELFVLTINHAPRIAFHRHESGKTCLEFFVIGTDSNLYYPFCNLMGLSDDEISDIMMATFIDWSMHFKREVKVEFHG